MIDGPLLRRKCSKRDEHSPTLRPEVFLAHGSRAGVEELEDDLPTLGRCRATADEVFTLARLFHYTVADLYERIVADGFIKQATAGVFWERPAVWFSTHPLWEPTADKMIVDPAKGICRTATREEMESFGLVRIEVAPETAPHDWFAFKRLSGIKPKVAQGLYRIGISWGARPGQWFVSFDRVPQDKWLSVEFWNGEKWQPQPSPIAMAA